MSDPRAHILQGIKEYTEDLYKEWCIGTFDIPIEYMFRLYKAPDRDTAYLIIRRGNRILFYGIDNYGDSIKQFSDPDNGVLGLELFCRRKEFDKGYELDMLLEDNSDERIDGLDEVFPGDDDSNEDFFLTNAMWLLDPMVH
jgi:hypothetical protein